MPNNTSRSIHHYDWKLHPFPDTEQTAASRFYPNELYKLLKPRIDAEESAYLVAKGQAGFRIVKSQLNLNGRYLAMLVQHTDTRAADPHFVNVKTWKARRVTKGAGDGVGACCHVVVAIDETNRGSQSFRTVVEYVPGISRSIIERLLNAELKIVCAGNYYYEKGKSQKDVRPIGELMGLPSDELVKGIVEGRLDSVFLVTQATVENWDQESYIKEGENILRLEVDPLAKGEKAWSDFRSIFGRAKEEKVRAMRLRFRENGRAQNVEIDLSADTIEDTLFNKVSTVTVDTPLDSYSEVLRLDLLEAMLPLLRQP